MVKATALPARWMLTGIWLAVALGFALLLVLAGTGRDPLDAPDPARQRPGILDLDGLPEPAPEIAPGIPRPGRLAVVFFERPQGLAGLCRALQGDPLPDGVDVVVVISAEGERCPGGTPVVVDRSGAVARSFGLGAPLDEGPPVGYAVVDAGRQIRYRTLDPHGHERLDEVTTIVEEAR